MRNSQLPKHLSPIFFNLLKDFLSNQLGQEIIFKEQIDEGLNGRIIVSITKLTQNVPIIIFSLTQYGSGWGWGCNHMTITPYMKKNYSSTYSLLNDMMKKRVF